MRLITLFNHLLFPKNSTVIISCNNSSTINFICLFIWTHGNLSNWTRGFYNKILIAFRNFPFAYLFFLIVISFRKTAINVQEFHFSVYLFPIVFFSVNLFVCQHNFVVIKHKHQTLVLFKSDIKNKVVTYNCCGFTHLTHGFIIEIL